MKIRPLFAIILVAITMVTVSQSVLADIDYNINLASKAITCYSSINHGGSANLAPSNCHKIYDGATGTWESCWEGADYQSSGYISIQLNQAHNISALNITQGFNNYYAGHINIEFSTDSTNGIDGTWRIVDTYNFPTDSIGNSENALSHIITSPSGYGEATWVRFNIASSAAGQPGPNHPIGLCEVGIYELYLDGANISSSFEELVSRVEALEEQAQASSSRVSVLEEWRTSADNTINSILSWLGFSQADNICNRIGQCGNQTPASFCGDGTINQESEDCDGLDLNGQTCVSTGYDSGTLSCSQNCVFDKTGCYTAACYNDNDCAGLNTTKYWCNYGDVTRYDRGYLCANPGMPNAYCDSSEKVKYHHDTCVSGEICIEGLPECQPKACTAQIDAMLVIDKSGSMNGDRLTYAKTASVAFANFLNISKDRVGLSSFNETAKLNQGLTDDVLTVTSKINSLAAGGQTNIGDGIKIGKTELITNGGANKALVILTDGAPNAMTQLDGTGKYCFIEPTSPTNCTLYALTQADSAKAEGIQIYTIGLGVSNFTQGLLKQIASDESKYYYTTNASVLESIYLNISKSICP
jgi:Mg-chelatase subunit ChlD